ncbi:MAG: Na+/H+ antiporter subunit E [Acidimicrobiia bacterium]
MKHSIAIVLALTVVWMALWESASVGTVLAGLAVGGTVIWIIPSYQIGAGFALRPIRVLRLMVFFARALAVATALVAWEVVTPRSRINQGIVKIPMLGESKGLVTIIANMISLTPGTLTIEVREDPMTLYVHVLHLRTVEEARQDVRKLESLVIGAFGDDPSGPSGEVAT